MLPLCWVRDAQRLCVAQIIENEFGEVGIDEKIIGTDIKERIDEEIIEVKSLRPMRVLDQVLARGDERLYLLYRAW